MSSKSSPPPERTLRIGTRGSALALAQAHQILRLVTALFPARRFELQIIRTTGDKATTASLSQPASGQPAGLFTKELEQALLQGEIDVAVHSLKDLPTDLSQGLTLTAVPQRADVREVLLYRNADAAASRGPSSAEWRPGSKPALAFAPGLQIRDLPGKAVVATSSTRRAAQLTCLRPGIQVVPIRGNVGTRLQKLRDQADLDVTLLAAAGLARLRFDIAPGGALRIDPRLPQAVRSQIEPPPAGILASPVPIDVMLPAVGQGAIGLETRDDDPVAREVFGSLNHRNTFLAVTAERSFLRAMGGGCASPVAAHARVVGHLLRLSASVFGNGRMHTAEASMPVSDPEKLGMEVAARLR